VDAPLCTADPVEDIGHGVTIERRYIDGVLSGVAYQHPDKTGQKCKGYVPVGTPLGWQLVSQQPLTLAPSLLCRRCKHHGFIRGGKWVPC
jgi:uncharacterized membrane protein